MTRLVLLLAALAGCAGPGMDYEASNAAWDEAIDAWAETRTEELTALRERDPEGASDATERMANELMALSMAKVHSSLKAVRSDFGVLKRVDAVTLVIETGPPGGQFTLYSARDLAMPQPVRGEADAHDSFWVLPRDAQIKETSGTLDARGGARVTVAAADAPFVVYQATLRTEGSRSCTNPVGIRAR